VSAPVFPPALRLNCLTLGALLVCTLPLPAQGSWPVPNLKITVTPELFHLSGLHEGRQLLVAAQSADGRPRDLTREARYTVIPTGIVYLTASGYVRPIRAGEATIQVTVAGQTRPVKVVVGPFDENRPLNFANEIVPLLTRHGCNAGGCHGKASGQNGFKLSLFGFDPAFDYDAIVKEARGRRVFAAAPGQSLLLTKPTAQVPHGGGRRLDPDAEAYQTLRRWLEQGAPRGDDQARTLQTLQMVPDQRLLDRHRQQQLAVLASYSDGTVRDVTRQAQFQSNEMPVAAVDENGVVQTFEQAGEATIMARYQGQVATFRATVPLGKPIARYPDFAVTNYVDQLALAKWQKLGILPSDLCTDHEFMRRVSLDLCGKLPAPDEVRAFLADQQADKRARLIDRLLDTPDYAAFFALRWGSILRNSSQANAEPVAYTFHEWIRDMIARNRPYDEFVRGIVAASGEWQETPAVNWFWQMRDDQYHQPAADTAQVFLGLRLQCARCHHHPYERWSQDDYYGLAGFFARLGRKEFGEPPLKVHAYFCERRPTTEIMHPQTGNLLAPKLLDGPALDVPPEEDPRHKLVDWMARPDNPFFARALCNRLWGHLLGRGLVDPVDDLRETNPPSNPALLDALAQDFIAHHFDVKHVLRTICQSRTYQLSSAPNDYNRHDRQNHARYYGKRLIAEVFLDAVDQVCGTRTPFPKMPRRARAVELPHEGFASFFLDVFDRPGRASACECARGSGASLPQVLHLVNSTEIEDKLAHDQGRVAKLVQGRTPPEKALDELYLAALARYPDPEEKTQALAYLARQKDYRRGLEDVAWTLINCREFMFNH
jgi:hypothetical protein